MKYDGWLQTLTFICIIVLLEILLSGCTRTKKMTEYDIDCKQCSFKMNRMLDNKEFEQGL